MTMTGNEEPRETVHWCTDDLIELTIACGDEGGPFTKRPDRVTCPKCKARLGERPPTTEEVLRAAIVAQTRQIIRDLGDRGYLESLEALPPELQRVIMDAMDQAEERDA